MKGPSYIDQAGETAFALQVTGLTVPSPFLTSYFSEGLAVIATGGSHHMFVLSGAKYGYVDKSGQIAIRPEFDFADAFSEGLALVRIGQSRTAAPEFGYIDRSGRVVIQPQFYSASSFSEGLARIALLDEDSGSLKHGFIDKTGKPVIRPQFSSASRFSEGLASVRTGGKHGYIDVTGRFAIPPRFETAFPFSEGLAKVGIAPLPDIRYGYIDKRGQMVIKLPARALPGVSPGFGVPSSLHAWGGFSEGLINVNFFDEEGRQSRSGYVDKKGNVVIPTRFDSAGPFNKGMAAVEFRDRIGRRKSGYIDKKGDIVWEAEIAEKRRLALSAKTAPRLPAPRLAYKGKEDYEVRGKEFTRYLLTITNRQAYSNELFKPSPELPPIGRNTSAARTTVKIRDAGTDRHLYGFVGLESSANLDKLWFAVRRGGQPPRAVYVVLYDRKLIRSSKSNVVDLDEAEKKLILVRNAEGDLPTPQLSYQRKVDVRGDKFTRHVLTITNRQAYPNDLFVPSPELPPIGRNRSASRTTVTIRDADSHRHLYGFVAFKSSDQLATLWFAVRRGAQPPRAVYVVLYDRKLIRSYKSNLVELPES